MKINLITQPKIMIHMKTACRPIFQYQRGKHYPNTCQWRVNRNVSLTIWIGRYTLNIFYNKLLIWVIDFCFEYPWSNEPTVWFTRLEKQKLEQITVSRISNLHLKDTLKLEEIQKTEELCKHSMSFISKRNYMMQLLQQNQTNFRREKP